MKSVYRIFWISLVVKLVFSAFLPITSDESYYWVWAHHPQLNYFDHPAMVSWLFFLGQPFDPFGSASRWVGILMGQGTIFIWIYLLKIHLGWDEQNLKNWLWLALLNPLFGAGALIITPDIPLLFFWSLGLLAFLNLIQSPSSKNGLALGTAIGLGMISKYMIVLLPLSLLVGSVWRRDWWKKVGAHLPIIFLGTFLGAAPFLIWNIQNDWISVKFQMDHGLGATHWKPSWTWEYVLLQIGILFPPIFYLMVRSIRKSPVWLISVGVFPFLFFFLTSFSGYVEANWPIAAYPAALALAVHGGGGEKLQLWTRWVWGIFITLAFLLVTTKYSPLSKPIKTKEFFEFESLYELPLSKSPLYARSYQMASRLSFENKLMVYKLRGLNRKDSFDFWEGSQPTEHFFLILESHESLPEMYLDKGYVQLNEQVVSERYKLLEVQKQ